MTRIRLTLHAQSADDTVTHAGEPLLKENRLQLAPKRQDKQQAGNVQLTDVGVAAFLAAKSTGARISSGESRAARTRWLLIIRWPDGHLRMVRHEMPVGAPLLEFRFDAPPLRVGEFARALHATTGDRVWHFQHGPALEKVSGAPAKHATDLWLTILGRKSTPPTGQREQAKKAGEGTTKHKKEERKSTPPPPAKPLGPPLDAWAALGLKPDAPWDDVRNAYRKLAQALHPDKHAGDPLFNEHFRRVNDAYDRLKTHYDVKAKG